MNRRRKSAYLQALERRREEARRQQPEEETSETEAPQSRILVERGPIMWPKPKRKAHWK
jgi:hypothetical protein